MGRLALLALAVVLTLLTGAAAASAGTERNAATKRTIFAACATKSPHARARCLRGRAAFKHVAGRSRARPATPSSAAGGTDAAGAGSIAGGGYAAAPGPAANGVIAGAPAAPVASTVGAVAYDFGTFVLRLTHAAVPTGSLTIYFRNHDASEHNLWLDPPGLGAASVQISDAVPENAGATKTVTVTPGTWRLYCSLAGHGSMTRDLTVG